MKKTIMFIFLFCGSTTMVFSNDDHVNSMAALQQYLQQNPQAAESLQKNMDDNSLKNVTSMLQQNPNLANQLQKDMGVNQNTADTNGDAASSDTTPTVKMPDKNSPDYYWEVPIAGDDDNSKAMASREKAAFQAVVQGAFPLSPEQIKQLHNMLDETQRAAATEPYELPPQPTSSSTIVNLAPGSVPPVIRLARGFVSSLVFIDSTGAPWPIQAYDLGNPDSFNISWNKKDNTLMVQARTSYNVANLAVKLKGMDTPVMLTLIAGQKVVDYRVDLRIQGYGPNAKPAVGGVSLPGQTTTLLLNILDGVPPKGAKRLKVSDGESEGWFYEGELYFRTRAQVISPAWLSKVSSADGMNAYEMQNAPTVLVSRHGKIVSIKLDGF